LTRRHRAEPGSALSRLNLVHDLMRRRATDDDLTRTVTVVAVAAEKNSTLVLPFPVELLRFLERAAPAPAAPVAPVAPVAPAAPVASAAPVAAVAPQPVQEQLPPAEPQSDPDSDGAISRQD
ncbi:hypothetical protein AB0I50_00850, partial [Streptomyces prunicolor]